MNVLLAPLIAALPWTAAPVALWWRSRGSPSLDDVGPLDDPAAAPLVAVVVPARNEARNIERCARSVLATTYPALELVVVDDCSEDDTGAIARRIAASDPRVRVIETPPRREGWFGKQWACATGARATTAPILLFADADTVLAPDLVPRMVAAVERSALDMLTIVGVQEVASFWERVVQPQAFGAMMGRFGGPRVINASPRVIDKFANGQCLMLRRAAYDAVGGHEGVRATTSDDVAIAQRCAEFGLRGEVWLGLRQLQTRMYTSLGELVDGWTKTMYVGAALSVPKIKGALTVMKPMLLVGPLFSLAPAIALFLWALGLASASIGVGGAIGYVANALWNGALLRRLFRAPAAYGVLYPLGAAVMLYITARAISRGDRVEWKGRAYRTA